MDLGSESVEENEVNHDENGGAKGEDSVFDEKLGFEFDGNFGVKPDQEGIVGELGSEEAVNSNSKETKRKGVGLKKWKRIKRNIVRDHNSSADDSSKVLKRGLSGSGNANMSENLRGVKEKNDGSSNAFGNVVFSDGFAIRGSSSDSRYAVGSGFVVGTDSENSEDRSSKSSTAASEPKVKHEKNRGSTSRNTNSKSLVNSAPKVQQGKGRIESSIKLGGGGRVLIEKENSISSSMESDSRSNYKHGVFTVTSNGKHSGKPHVHDDGGNSGEAHTNERFSKGDETGYDNENGEEPVNSAANLSWIGPEDKSENSQSTIVEDPLIESIRSLQAVQEALEEELQKFRDIGTEVVSPDDDSAKCISASAGITTVDLGHSSTEEIKQAASSSLEFQISSLTQDVNLMESKLKELQGVLAVKDSRIVELETALSSGNFPKKESANTVGLSDEKYREVEYEIEGLYMQKIEAEVEYLAIKKVIQNYKVGTDSQLALLKEQEKLSENQAQVLNKLVDAEGRASVLKNKAEELEKYCDDSLVIEESFVLQKRLCKVSFYLFLQFIMLILFFWFLVSEFSLNSELVVPT